MKRAKFGYLWSAAWLILIGTWSGCSSIGERLQPKPEEPLPRGGEPTVEEKSRRAAKRKAVHATHASLGPADLDPHKITHLAQVGGVDVLNTSPFRAAIFAAGLEVDADGAPRAYHPKPDSGKGLDSIKNAGSPGKWWGIVTDTGSASGQPIVQSAHEPAPGYFVSSTSLEDPNFLRTDPRRYVDASKVPFFVLPVDNYLGGRVGDIAAIVNFSNGKVAYAIAADTGPRNKLGEGSIALAKALGVDSSARSGGTGGGIGYCMFPDSGTQRPLSLEKINRIGRELFADFGGVEELRKHLNQ